MHNPQNVGDERMCESKLRKLEDQKGKRTPTK